MAAFIKITESYLFVFFIKQFNTQTHTSAIAENGKY